MFTSLQNIRNLSIHFIIRNCTSPNLLIKRIFIAELPTQNLFSFVWKVLQFEIFPVTGNPNNQIILKNTNSKCKILYYTVVL